MSRHIKGRCSDCGHTFYFHNWGICGVYDCRVWLKYADSRCPAMSFQDEATSEDLGILLEK